MAQIRTIVSYSLIHTFFNYFVGSDPCYRSKSAANFFGPTPFSSMRFVLAFGYFALYHDTSAL